MDDENRTADEQMADSSANGWEVVAELAGEFIPEPFASDFFAELLCFALAIPLIWLLVLMIQSIAEEFTGGPPQSLFSG